MNYRNLNIFKHYKKKLNKQKPDDNIKVGDTVNIYFEEITSYSHYDEMAKHMKLTNWTYGNSLYDDSKATSFVNEFTVMAKANHPLQGHELYGIRNNSSGKDYIVEQKTLYNYNSRQTK